MKTKDEVMELLKKHKKEISERFAVRALGLFGSYARGAASAASDVDIVVDFDEPTFDHYMDLKFYLEKLLGSEVDLVLADSIKPRLKPYVEKDMIYA
jgi:predicted nucleotidyltransferase